MNTTTGNFFVDEISKMNLIGNIIPHTWYSRIKTPSGKTDLNAIVILAEIIYWYRATEALDGTTATVTGYKKKFDADLLQKSYDDFSKKLGLTKRQVKDAIKRLEDNGLIIRHFREVKFGDSYLNNVLYIEPVIENIKTITFGEISQGNKKKEVLINNEVKTNENNATILEREENKELKEILNVLKENNITDGGKYVSNTIKNLLDKGFEKELIIKAFKLSLIYNADNKWAYALEVMKQCQDDGIKTLKQYMTEDEKRRNKKEPKSISTSEMIRGALATTSI